MASAYQWLRYQRAFVRKRAERQIKTNGMSSDEQIRAARSEVICLFIFCLACKILYILLKICPVYIGLINEYLLLF